MAVPTERAVSGFAATVNGGRVRIDQIVGADAPGLWIEDPTSIVVPVAVKGCRGLRFIGGFPSAHAAIAWCDRHLPIANTSPNPKEQ